MGTCDVAWEHLRAHRFAFSLSGSIWDHLEGSVRLFRVAELFGDDFQTILHFAELPTLGPGILFQGERLEYLPEYIVQLLSVWLLWLIQRLLRNIAFLDRNRLETNHYDAVGSGHLADLRR